MKSMLLKNWKTSAGGLVLLVLAGLGWAGIEVPGITVPKDPAVLFTIFVNAIGLFAAKDGDKTGI